MDKSESVHQPAHRRLRTALWMVPAIAISLTAIIAGLSYLGPHTDRSPISGFSPAGGQRIFPELANDADQIRRIHISNDVGSLGFVRAESGWRTEQFDGYPASVEALDDLVAMLAQLRAEYEHDDSSMATAISTYGAADATLATHGTGTTVQLTGEDGGSLAQLTIGNTIKVPGPSGLLDMTALSMVDEQQLWLVGGEVVVPVNAGEWVDHQVLDVPRQSVVSFSSRSPQGDGLELGRGDDGTPEVLAASPEIDGTVQGWKLDQVISGFENLRFIDVRSVADLRPLGDSPWSTTITMDDGALYEAKIYPSDEASWVVFRAGASDDGDLSESARSFNARHGDWAYRLPLNVLHGLMVTPETLR